MVNIPARIRRKYGFNKGTKVLFVEQDGSVLMIPLMSLREMRGLGRDHAEQIIESIKELEAEHREEARNE
jgi:bifunctional DNA-binding transcriptional regulator/antitoxin component of YhaV-PrlF toxin-antitoxin module